eukprot:CAMPEP_0201115394 /NCGR_PEP_ID=MMETSP0812-20130820/78905_1 /ASSEMBLY_ACC=CAM_ASM_000668 /TAXON_ID=98059 /ORGANISM="Dinobryon sp., Strain UTEXLB2267" /LENGTH=38 /DNA_ID= /DNA_START= /DNA_END= /DNA_ORIENTATION=
MAANLLAASSSLEGTTADPLVDDDVDDVEAAAPEKRAP